MRRFLALALAASLFLSFACSGDDDDGGEDENGGESTTSADSSAAPGEPTRTPAPPRPSPTPVPDDGTALKVFAPQARLVLTMADIRALPQSTIEGFDEEGVTLETIAAEAAFSGD